MPQPDRGEKTCTNCVFFFPLESNRGECRRYPPIEHPNGSDIAKYLLVVMHYWCGEWSRKA